MVPTRESTFIDGGGATNPANAILSMSGTGQTPATVIEDLTLQNGKTDIAEGGGALRLTRGGSPTFRNVDFLNNAGGVVNGGGAHISLRQVASAPLFDRCTFLGGQTAYSAVALGESSAQMRQCLVADNATAYAVGTPDTVSALILNSTISHGGSAAVRAASGATLTMTNTAVVGGVDISGTLVANRCLYASASGNNINGDAYEPSLGCDQRLAGLGRAGGFGVGWSRPAFTQRPADAE